MNYQERLLNVIPGGAHTYSRGFDQFPRNAPEILVKGKGAYVYDSMNTKYLDYGMALRSINLGYANEYINKAAIKQIEFGNNLTRPSLIELQAAELFIDLIDSAEMVKFTKNGSTATTAAVKLSRAYTSRDIVLRCQEHPFFSYDDWFIGSTVIDKGVVNSEKRNTLTFKYNNIESLEKQFEQYPNQIACVILEPATTEHPQKNFLKEVKKLCRKNGAIFILDEMITGFRWDLKGAQKYYDIDADLCTFGKAMANGFSVAAVAGRREIMQLGSTELIGKERTFLLSSTHGAEMNSLGAFIATTEFMLENQVIAHNWSYGEDLINLMNAIAKDFGIEKNFIASGIACSPYYLTLDNSGNNCFGLRTLFSQEMIKNGVLMPWISISFAHGESEFMKTKIALEKSLAVLKKAIESDYRNFLIGETIKPVFRRYN